MRTLLIFIFLTSSCAALKEYPEIEKPEPWNCDEIDPDPFLGPVETQHLRFCSRLCISAERVKRVIREAETIYVRCQCTTGTEFRVARVKFNGRQR
jgi:hypothetical protein